MRHIQMTRILGWPSLIVHPAGDRALVAQLSDPVEARIRWRGGLSVELPCGGVLRPSFGELGSDFDVGLHSNTLLGNRASSVPSIK